MERRIINPTPWLQHFHINHGVEVKGAARNALSLRTSLVGP